MHVEVEIVGSSRYLIQVCNPNSSAIYLKFVEDISDDRYTVKANESTIFLGDFNAQVGKDAGASKGAVGKRDDADVKDNRRLLLELCCNNALCIINTSNTEICTSLTWYKDSLGQRSFGGFCIVSAYFFQSVLNVCV